MRCLPISRASVGAEQARVSPNLFVEVVGQINVAHGLDALMKERVELGQNVDTPPHSN